MTTVEFEQISNDPKELSEHIEQIRNALDSLPGVKATFGPARYYTFPTSPRSEQWRATVRVSKQGRATTWNAIYTTVNNLFPGHAPRYRRL